MAILGRPRKKIKKQNYTISLYPCDWGAAQQLAEELGTHPSPLITRLIRDAAAQRAHDLERYAKQSSLAALDALAAAKPALPPPVPPPSPVPAAAPIPTPEPEPAPAPPPVTTLTSTPPFDPFGEPPAPFMKIHMPIFRDSDAHPGRPPQEP